MTDDAPLTELVEWWEDISVGGIGSRVVIATVPSGWGRTTLLSAFATFIEEAEPFTLLVALDGENGPTESAEFVNWLEGRTSLQGPVAELAKRMLGVDRFERTAATAAGIAGATVAPLLGGILGVAIQLCLGAELTIREEFFPRPWHRARRVGARLAQVSVDGPVAVLLDNADTMDAATLDGFLTGLVERPTGQVLGVVIADHESDLARRLLDPSRFDVRGRVVRLHPSDARMDLRDRQQLCFALAPDWPQIARDRLVMRSRTFKELRTVLSTPGAADVPGAFDPLMAVEALVEAMFEPRLDDYAAVFIAWCGGVVHTHQLSAAGFNVDSNSVHVNGKVARLRQPDQRQRLSEGAPRLDRHRLASIVTETATAVLADVNGELVSLVAALRPVVTLLESGDLLGSDTALGLAAALVKTLSDVGDTVAAFHLAARCIELAEDSGLQGPVIDHLVALAEQAAAVSSMPAEAAALAAAVADPDRAALFGVEARNWAAIIRVADQMTRAKGIDEALRLHRELDANVYGRIAFEWRLYLGTALCQAGAAEPARTILAPVLGLPIDDEIRQAAELAALTASPAGDVLLAIRVLEDDLVKTSTRSDEEQAWVHGALARLHEELGSWNDALLHGQESLKRLRDLRSSNHPDLFFARYKVAEWTGKAGQAHRAVALFEELLPDFIRVFGVEDPATLAIRDQLACYVSEGGDVARAILLSRELLSDELRLLGPYHEHTLSTRSNLACWLSRHGDLQRALVVHEELLPDLIRVRGQDHPHTLTTRQNIAECVRATGNPARALTLSEQLLHDRVRVLGPDHPDTLATREIIALSINGVHGAANALPLFEQLLIDRVRVLGPDHPQSLATRLSVAMSMSLVGETGRALTYLEQLLSDARRVLGVDHRNTVLTRAAIARCTGRGPDRAHAVTLLEEVLPDMVTAFGPDHPYTQMISDDIARYR